MVALECGSELISLLPRQIEGADFDNVRKEISFRFFFIPSVPLGRLRGWLSAGAKYALIFSLLCIKLLTES